MDLTLLIGILLGVLVVMALGIAVLIGLNLAAAHRARDEAAARQLAEENAPIPWGELRRWRTEADARLREAAARIVAIEEQTRVLRELVGVVADIKGGLHDVKNGLNQMAARLDTMGGVVSTIAQERIAERAARESRWEDRRANDPPATTQYIGTNTVQGPAIGGNVHRLEPPGKNERTRPP